MEKCNPSDIGGVTSSRSRELTKSRGRKLRESRAQEVESSESHEDRRSGAMKECDSWPTCLHVGVGRAEVVTWLK